MEYKEFKDKLENGIDIFSKYTCCIDEKSNNVIVLSKFRSMLPGTSLDFDMDDPFAIINSENRGTFTLNPGKVPDGPWNFNAKVFDLIREYAYTPVEDRNLPDDSVTHINDLEVHSNYSGFDTETILLDSAKNDKPKTITKDFIDEMKKKNVDSEISKDRRTITLKRNGKTIAHVSTVIRYKASIMVDLPKDLAEPILKYTSTSAKDRGETPADPNDVNITLHGEKAKAFRNVLSNLQSLDGNFFGRESIVLNLRNVDANNAETFASALLRIRDKINQSSERK